MTLGLRNSADVPNIRRSRSNRLWDFEGAGITLRDVVERFHSRTLHVDLKDCREIGKGHDTVVFGEGVTDFDAFLSELLSRDYCIRHRYGPSFGTQHAANDISAKDK